MQGMSASDFRSSVIEATGMTEEQLVTAGQQSLAAGVSAGTSWLDKIVDTARTVLPKAIASANAAIAQLSFSGSTGNFLAGEDNIVLTAKCYRMTDQCPEKLGSPLYSTVLINTLSGFVKCQNAAFGADHATAEEEIAIEAFMNNGFFFE